MKVAVDEMRCGGHGRCASIAPDVFDLDDEGYVRLDDSKTVLPDQEAVVREAVEMCPLQALRIE